MQKGFVLQNKETFVAKVGKKEQCISVKNVRLTHGSISVFETNSSSHVR